MEEDKLNTFSKDPEWKPLFFFNVKNKTHAA